ncbi:MAG: hypothetical protein ABSF10_12945 [Verrucomicrobiota bacterium]|jgi:hypothetical protein
MKNDAPVFGKYVKLIPTGEILKLKSYDPKSQLLEIELPTGGFSIVRWNEIDRITPNEELEFLRAKKKNSN